MSAQTTHNGKRTSDRPGTPTPMNDVALMQVVDGIQHLSDCLRGVLLGEFAIFADSVKQLTTGRQLGDNVEFVLGIISARTVESSILPSTHLRFEPVHEMDNVGVVESLEHLQLVVDHTFVALDIFLQDDLDGDLARGAIGLPHDTIGAGTEGSSKFVQRSVAGHGYYQVPEDKEIVRVNGTGMWQRLESIVLLFVAFGLPRKLIEHV